MAKFIKLTGDYGKPVWINPEQITDIVAYKSESWDAADGRVHEATIHLSCSTWHKLRETPEQILALIAEGDKP